MPMYRRLSFTAAHFGGWAPEPGVDARRLRAGGEFLAITLNALLELLGVGWPAFLASQLGPRAQLTDRGANVVDAMRLSHVHTCLSSVTGRCMKATREGASLNLITV